MVMIILFITLSLVNVVLSTIKSIVTVKGTTFQSACVNAMSYGLYTVIVVFTAGCLHSNYFVDLTIKVMTTIATNFIGVYISAWILNKIKKDKLWEIVATVQNTDMDNYKQFLNMILSREQISFNCMETNKHGEYVYHIYSENQEQSRVIKKALSGTNAHYIVHEEEVKLL